MSALAPVENQRPLVSPRASLHEVTANGDVPTWELHSELVLVCPVLRSRSLVLLPERDADARPTGTPAPTVLPLQVSAEDEVSHGAESLLRFALRRIGETARFVLQVIGAIVMLLVLAEAFAH